MANVNTFDKDSEDFTFLWRNCLYAIGGLSVLGIIWSFINQQRKRAKVKPLKCKYPRINYFFFFKKPNLQKEFLLTTRESRVLDFLSRTLIFKAIAIFFNPIYIYYSREEGELFGRHH